MAEVIRFVNPLFPHEAKKRHALVSAALIYTTCSVFWETATYQALPR